MQGKLQTNTLSIKQKLTCWESDKNYINKLHIEIVNLHLYL